MPAEKSIRELVRELLDAHDELGWINKHSHPQTWDAQKNEYNKALDALRAALADDAPGEMMRVLPDGSAFFTASLPLPTNHWLYAPRTEEWDRVRDTTADTPHPILTHEQRGAVVAAVRYAIRGATMCGKVKDFDPDALVQNAVYALCGPYNSAILAAKDAKSA